MCSTFVNFKHDTAVMCRGLSNDVMLLPNSRRLRLPHLHH